MQRVYMPPALPLAPLPQAPSTPSSSPPPPETPALADSTRNESLRLVVACGPFTAFDNLDYKPLIELGKLVAVEKPHVLLLMGPVVDARHQLLDTLTECTFDQLFEMRIRLLGGLCRKFLFFFFPFPLSLLLVEKAYRFLFDPFQSASFCKSCPFYFTIKLFFN